MAYCPTNARSEFVRPANFSGGGVSETTRRFQDASPAFMSPGFKPTRGSGFGATVDRFAPPEDAHAAREHSPTVSPNNAVNLMASVLHHWPVGWKRSAASIFCMRAISVVWSANTSEA